jgi:hypothetical protein
MGHHCQLAYPARMECHWRTQRLGSSAKCYKDALVMILEHTRMDERLILQLVDLCLNSIVSATLYYIMLLISLAKNWP